MSGIENKLLTLSLNSSWQPIGYKLVKEAITDLFSQFNKDEYAYHAIDITYEQTGEDEFDFSTPVSMNPCSWAEWIALPVRSFDFAIHSPTLAIRVPTVIISRTYNGMPVKRLRLSRDSIFVRDKGVCQYSGAKLTKKDGDVDHIMPLSRGGKSVWNNMVFCAKQINREKGCKTPREAGLRLIKTPAEPKTVPVISVLNQVNSPDWSHFIIK